jgi:KTSC domain
VERKNVTSKILRSVGYDVDAQILEVEFLASRKDDTRKVYQYLDVPMEKALAMSQAESKGSYFLKFIKPNYKFKRVEEKLEDKKKVVPFPDAEDAPPAPEEEEETEA